MRYTRRRLLACAMVMSLWFGIGTVGTANADPITQLGFALDASGSVSTANYNLLRSGLSNALAALPLDGTVEITVVSYGSNVITVTSPTLLTAATLPIIQAQIASHLKDSGSTNTAGAITTLANLMTGSTLFDPTNNSIINLATDGFPNSQSAAEAAAAAAAAAGIDALSIEAIGAGVASSFALNNMALIAFPDPVTILPLNSTSIPNPIFGSFVVPISDFTFFPAVIEAKVIASVTPPSVPEPGLFALLALGVVGRFAATRRRRV